MTTATVRGPLVYATRTARAQAERLQLRRPLENVVADKIAAGRIVHGGNAGFKVVIADDVGIRAAVVELKRPGQESGGW